MQDALTLKTAELRDLHDQQLGYLDAPHALSEEAGDTSFPCLTPGGAVVKNAFWVCAGGGEVMRKWLRRVSAEHASLSASLPLAWTSSIFVAADPTRLDLLR